MQPAIFMSSGRLSRFAMRWWTAFRMAISAAVRPSSRMRLYATNWSAGCMARRFSFSWREASVALAALWRTRHGTGYPGGISPSAARVLRMRSRRPPETTSVFPSTSRTSRFSRMPRLRMLTRSSVSLSAAAGTVRTLSVDRVRRSSGMSRVLCFIVAPG